MNKKTNFPLILGWLLIPYGIYYYFSLHGVELISLEKYGSVFRHWILLIALILLLVCIWISKYTLAEKEQTTSRQWIGWLAGLLLMLGVVFGLFVYVNPHARFSSARFPSVTPGARAIKTEYYKNLDEIPNLIILGSSRAFTLSPKYLKKQTGYQAFNMSVEGARGGDYAIQLKYIRARDVTPPNVFIIELSQASLPEKLDYFNPELQPISLIPYMPLRPLISVVDGMVKDSLGLQSFSDSIYLLTTPDVKNRLIIWHFNSDGLGARNPVNYELYQLLLKSDIKERIKSMQCNTLPNKTSRQAFEDVLKLAWENNIGVVIYQSPVNGAFYDAAYQSSPTKFKLCHRIMSGYLESLESKYPNVFVHDLSSYKEINDLRENGFYDAIHLRPVASEMVIDALLPDIESAMAWAREKRNQPSP